MFRIVALLCLAVILLSVAPRPAHAAQSYDNCTGFITSLPAVISSQGTWCLKHDLNTAMTSGSAITIAANNVTVDCNDFKLGGLAAGLATATNGVRADNRLNSTVRRCNIRGFIAGVQFIGSGGGNVVEDNRFDNNTFCAIQITGNGSTIRRNRVFDTGGSTGVGEAFGIDESGAMDIVDNTISGVVGTSGLNGTTIGISTANNLGGSVDGNRIRGVLKSGTGIAYGIKNYNDARLTLRENDVVGDVSTGSIGLHCDAGTSRAEGNVINGLATGLESCGDAGGNIVSP